MAYNLKIIRKWVKALESGKYKQCGFSLQRKDARTKRASYCCLGVLARVQNKRFDRSGAINIDGDYFTTSLPPSLLAGMSRDQQDSFITMNDIRGYNFKQIAQEIRVRILKQKRKKATK